MQFLRTALLTVTLALAGCVATPKLQGPRPQPPTTGYQLAHLEALDVTNHTLQHLNDRKNILYSQNFGGGGAGLGLLLGPLGVAANIGMIKQNTMADVQVLKDKIDVDADALFRAAADNMLPLAETAGTRLTPYLYVTKVDQQQLLFAAAVLIEQGAGADKWLGKYMYQLPLARTVSELGAINSAATEQLRNELRAGYVEILKRFDSEARAEPETEQKIKFKSDFLTPRFSFEQNGQLLDQDDKVTWIRAVGGVYGVRNSNITLSPAKR